MDNPEAPSLPESSLEGQETLAVAPGGSSQPAPKDGQRHVSRRLIQELIVVLLILLLVGGGILGYTAIHKSTSVQKQPSVVVNTQTLSSGTLTKLSGQAGQNGPVQLTISPSTLFKNDATVQKDLSVGGNLRVNGSSDLLGPVATGSNLTVGGGVTVAHNATVGGNLSVTGTITATSLNVGSINLSSLTLSSDLSVGGHIIPTGNTPGATGFTGVTAVRISGTDTAGTITFNYTGTNPLPGQLVTVNFYRPFALTPKVQLTPVNAEGASLQYFATQSPGFFTIQTGTAPARGAIYMFNYLVTQ